MRHILVLEPFGGGSHAALYRDWSKYTEHALTVLELPAVHWKWRSRHASWTLAMQAVELAQQTPQRDDRAFDLVFCSDMLNLPEWKGFAGPELARLPAVVYFHENQFSYPLADGQQRDYHLAYSNVLSAVAADQVWFNSEFHRQDFAREATKWLARMPDFKHTDVLRLALERATILAPGIDPVEARSEAVNPSMQSTDTSAGHIRERAITTIGWVARWEHDKRPDEFAHVVEQLVSSKRDFRLILLGQQFRETPEALRRIQAVAGDRILHCGFAESKAAYWHWLRQMDVVISTADHEFFGIAIAEAVHAGAFPLLPQRLAYPELLRLGEFPQRQRHFYNGVDELQNRLNHLLDQSGAVMATDLELRHLLWPQLAQEYDQAVEQIVAAQTSSLRRV